MTLKLSCRREFLARATSGCAVALLTRGARGELLALDENQHPTPIAPVHERIRADAAAAPLRMQFHGTTADQCRDWQRNFRAKLLDLLGNPEPPKQWKAVQETEHRFNDYSRHNLILSADGVGPLPVAILQPIGPRRSGVVVCVHGHGPYGHEAVLGGDDDPDFVQSVAASNYDYARQLVRQGFTAVAPCLTPFGRRLGDRAGYGSQDPCAVTFIRLQLLGRILMGENLRDLLWTIEYIRSRPDMEADRIGCVGLSYGGRMTMLAAAVSPVIRVAVVSGALNVMQERITGYYSCGAQVIPGLLQYGDIPEIGSLIAPRPCLWEVGSRDDLIDPGWAATALVLMGRAYSAYGAANQLQVDRFDGGHRWNGTAALPLLASALG